MRSALHMPASNILAGDTGDTGDNHRKPRLSACPRCRGLTGDTGDVEAFNGKLRDELLNGEMFNTLREAQVLIEEWRRHDNRVRPHSSLGYRPPAPETAPMARSQIGSGAGAAAMAH